MDHKKRCRWCNPNNPLYVAYHDHEWGRPDFDDRYLFEMLILESFQAGLSWECVLNKREHFRQAYDHFEIDKIIAYDETKVNELLNQKNIACFGRFVNRPYYLVNSKTLFLTPHPSPNGATFPSRGRLTEVTLFANDTANDTTIERSFQRQAKVIICLPLEGKVSANADG